MTLQQAAGDAALSEWLINLVESLDCQGPSRVFEALNTACLDSALVIHVAEGADAGRLHIDWLQAVENRLDNFRVFVLLEKDAQLQLLETYSSTAAPGPGAMSVINLLTQVQLAESAQFDHLRVQGASAQQHLLQFVSVDQAKESQYRYTGFEMGGGLVRTDLSCQLNGPGAKTDLAAAFIGNGESCIDHHIIADHRATNCFSEQNFRGVLGGRSKGVFNGKAVIQPGADGSKVLQSNANLLLSDLAEMNTKPELEIYADEVEASHGATVGQLDEQALFYLQTRGIAEADARRILTGAFCRAIGARLSDRKLVEQIESLLDRAMPGISAHDEIIG
jgi:Fe-S cluster assembly protein SufD